MSSYPTLNFLGRDYESIRRLFFERLSTNPQAWTDFNESDPLVTLAEALFAALDQLHYYIDARGTEAFLALARERKNIISHAHLIGYKVKTITPATAALDIIAPNTVEISIDLPETYIDEEVTVEIGYTDDYEWSFDNEGPPLSQIGNYQTEVKVDGVSLSEDDYTVTVTDDLITFTLDSPPSNTVERTISFEFTAYSWVLPNLSTSILNLSNMEFLIDGNFYSESTDYARTVSSDNTVYITLDDDVIEDETILNNSLNHTGAIRYLLDNDDALDYNVVIPAQTRFRANETGSNQIFYSNEAVTLQTSVPSVRVSAKQGTLVTETDHITNGKAFQVFLLKNSDVGEGTVSVTVDGEEWSSVLSFVQSTNADKHFTVRTDYTDTTYVTFGNGSNGYLPSSGSSVHISYLRTTGVDGNVGSGTITTIVDDLTDTNSNPVNLGVTNLQAASGGSDRETIESVKLNAPAYYAAQDRAVTRADYIALIQAIAGVGRATAWGEQEVIADWNRDNPTHPNYPKIADNESANYVYFSFLDTNANLPDPSLVDEVKSLLEEKKVITAFLTYIQPVFVPVHIDMTIYPYSDVKIQQAKTDVENVINNYFSINNMEFSRNVYQSNIVRLSDELDSIHHLDINSLTIVGNLQRHEIATLGSLTISIGDVVTREGSR